MSAVSIGRTRALLFLAIFGFTTLLTAGCGGSSTPILQPPTPTATATAIPSITPTPSATPTTSLASGSIVVTNSNGTILAYPPLSNGNIPPVLAITGEPSDPSAVTVDSSGDVYVANAFDNTVAVFAPGSSFQATPVVYINGPDTELNLPNALAVDHEGNIYVANTLGNNVTVYSTSAGGDTAPIATIGGPATNIESPFGVAIDSAGNIYVASGAAILEFKAGSNGNVPPIATIAGSATELAGPQGVALDNSDNIYVANNSSDAVTGYLAGSDGNVTPTLTIEGSDTLLNAPLGIALDSKNNIYVVDLTQTVKQYPAGSSGDIAPVTILSLQASSEPAGLGSGIALDSGNNLWVTSFPSDTVEQFAPGATGVATPLNIIAGVPNKPIGIELDSIHDIFVVSQNSVGYVTEFPAGTNGVNPAVLNNISGSSTDLLLPTGLALSSTDEIIVTNAAASANSITIYSPGSDGDVAPAREIQGEKTQLDHPGGVSHDTSGNIYVANVSGINILVFDSGAYGNVAPKAVLGGDKTALNGPIAVAVDAQGYIYVADSGKNVNIYEGNFEPDSVNNEAPTYVISGSNTNLEIPSGIKLDDKGNIYVTDDANNAILIFPPIANLTPGNNNIAPMATITGSNTQLNQPKFIAIAP